MTTTTKRYKTYKSDPAKDAKREAFRAMAQQLDGELKEGKHTQRLEKAQKEVQGIERYSPLNQLLILAQCPEVTEVHGYVEWQELGYQVRRGVTAISIRAPHTKAAGEGEEKGKVGFHRTNVFDRSQVDPIEPGTPSSSQSDQEPEPEAAPAAVD